MCIIASNRQLGHCLAKTQRLYREQQQAQNESTSGGKVCRKVPPLSPATSAARSSSFSGAVATDRVCAPVKKQPLQQHQPRVQPRKGETESGFVFHVFPLQCDYSATKICIDLLSLQSIAPRPGRDPEGIAPYQSILNRFATSATTIVYEQEREQTRANSVQSDHGGEGRG